MPHVRLSEQAQTDITRLYRFLAEQDQLAAKRAAMVIRDAFLPLKEFPIIGRPVEDHDALREMVIDFGASGYLALYRYEPATDDVTILAIKHQKEDDYK
jgi:plasmid stabilization system protein ParE